MSRAFVKEDVDLPERSGRKRSASGLPPGGATNYVTARGAKRLRDELEKLRAEKANSERVTELEQALASVQCCRSARRAVEHRHVRHNGDSEG
jgi:hypothetical protein